MKIKRALSLIICAVMMLAMIPAGVLAVSAAGTEGDWTVWIDPEKYEDVHGVDVIKPDSGYEYTDEGFTTIPPDWTNFTPYVTVQTKEAQPLKKGFYMQIRIDDYPYGGEDGNADHWIAFHLSDREGVKPGSVEYGNNWLCLLRGAGNGVTNAQSFLTTMTTDKKVGSFQLWTAPVVEVPMDDQGREIYTLEVIWNGKDYELKINGVVVSTQAISDSLKTWVESGDYYVGVTMHAGIMHASAALTILKYGTCEADAVTPVGSDYKEPEENGYVYADIADPDTVPTNQPAILWSPETYEIRNGENISFDVQGDGTWRATASESHVYWNFRPKNAWSYAAEDFPLFYILLRNAGSFSGVLSGATGGVNEFLDDYSVYFWGGTTYGKNGEYVFTGVSLPDLCSGRINDIMVGLSLDNREFDICFAGMFRSEGEAYAYAEEYLVERGVPFESVPETDPVVEPDPGWPDSQYPETQAPAPIDPETKAPEADPSETTFNDVEFIMTTLGCSGSVGGGVALMLLVGAVLLKKKED